MRADRVRLLDAIEQIELIRTFSEPGRNAFLNEILLQSAAQFEFRRQGPRPASAFPSMLARAKTRSASLLPEASSAAMRR
jgi:hypothetical protein